MKTPPKFLRGAFKSVIRFASQEANAASMARDERRQCRVEIVPLGPSDGVEVLKGVDAQEPSSRELRPVHPWREGLSLLQESEGRVDAQEPSSRELRPVHPWREGLSLLQESEGRVDSQEPSSRDGLVSSCTTAIFLRGGVGVQVSRIDCVGERQSERRRWWRKPWKQTQSHLATKPR